MAIARRADGAWTFAINSITPAIPAAQDVGDMMLLIAVGKQYDLGWSVSTAGWAALTRGESGTTATGIDAGSVAMQVWWKEATSATEANPTLTEDTPTWNVAGAAVAVFSKGASEVWSTPVEVYGADEVTGTSISVTFASDPGGLGGDYVMLACGINTDAMGPLTTDLTPAWTGITFGVANAGLEGETGLGHDMSGHYMSQPVDSGTSSAAPTATGTGTASGGADRLEAVFVRLRVTTGGDATATPSTVAAIGTIPAPTTQAAAETTPATVAGTSSVPAATVQAGAIVTASTIAAIATVPTPTIIAESPDALVTPATVAATSAIPAATISGTATVAPSTIAALATVPSPTIAATAVAMPAVVAVTASIPAPTIQGTAQPTPATVATTGIVPAVVVIGNAITVPATLAALGVVPTPTIVIPGGETLVAATTVAASVAIPAPVILANVGNPEGKAILTGVEGKAVLTGIEGQVSLTGG